MSVSAVVGLVARAEPSPSSTSLPDTTNYLSTTFTSLATCMTLMIGLSYVVGLSWAIRHARANPKPLNKGSGVHLQKYAPFVYASLVLWSFCDVAIASWLMLQWRFHNNFPTSHTRAAARLLLFASCWTTVTAAALSVLFVHPAWSRHPVSSVGSQSIWIIVSWVQWIVGAGLLNSSAPGLFAKRACGDVVYCGQIRVLFGVAVIQSLTLTAGMATVIWLAWLSARDAYALNSRPFSVFTRVSQMATA